MMSAISGSIDIAQPPDAVFAYVADVRRRAEWQGAVERIEVQTPDVVGVGLEVLETRRVPGGPRTFRWRVTECEPSTSWGFRGVDNPVNAIARMTFALDGGAGTRASFEIDFEAHGFGKLIAAFARRGTRREVPRDLARLKEQLEHS